MNTITAIFKAIGDTKFGRWSVRHAPQISIAMGGLLGAGALATTVIGTKRTCEQIDAEKIRRAEEINANAKKSQGGNSGKTQEVVKPVTKDDIHLGVKDTVKIGWKNFVLPAALGGGSLAAFIGAYKLEHNKTIALVGRLSATEATLLATNNELIEKLGEKKAEEIRKDVRETIEKEKAAEKVEQTKSEEVQQVTQNSNGDFVKYTESITQQELLSKPVNIELAVARADSYLSGGYMNEMSLNEWLGILEEVTGRELKRSAIGENLVFIKKNVNDTFKDAVRVAWHDAPGYEAAAWIEYRDKNTWTWKD